MAKLVGTYETGQGEQYVTLEIVPVTPSTDGPRDAYGVSVTEHTGDESSQFGRLFSVYKWPLGHIWMYRIARAFQVAYHIVDARLDFSLTPPELGLQNQENMEPIYITESIDWLKVYIRGRTRADGPRIFTEILIQTDWDEYSQRLDSRVGHFVRFFLSCTPEMSRNFGNALLKECIAARDMRKRLGLAVPEDNWK